MSKSDHKQNKYTKEIGSEFGIFSPVSEIEAKESISRLRHKKKKRNVETNEKSQTFTKKSTKTEKE
ncbi:hypothetical protein [Alkalicoccobacillus murimartini]|uniref:Uncharacterized protein n=1 Tax=Alkalicoccobacillus murimartini TaxID=171685 RepID=A0ABT9YET7_9BACI|nr:hypothetical protein [Alkalicoccobacillus murimartini]MDQ0206361.1 hypothetical protein [Alkalicoccobacillus murimartini]